MIRLAIILLIFGTLFSILGMSNQNPLTMKLAMGGFYGAAISFVLGLFIHLFGLKK